MDDTDKALAVQERLKEVQAKLLPIVARQAKLSQESTDELVPLIVGLMGISTSDDEKVVISHMKTIIGLATDTARRCKELAKVHAEASECFEEFSKATADLVTMMDKDSGCLKS